MPIKNEATFNKLKEFLYKKIQKTQKNVFWADIILPKKST